MIVTLTANPSFDRTVALAGPLERGAVMRAESMTSQAGGKGVNISRAAVAAGVPTLAVLPAAARTTRSSSSCSRAGIDCRPGPPAGRPPGQHHHHRARRHDHQAQQPRRRPRPPATLDRAVEALRRRAATAQLGGARRLAAARPPAGWYADLVAAAAPTAGAASPSTPARRPLARARRPAPARRPRT